MVVKVKKSETVKEKDQLKRVSKIYKMILELQGGTYFFFLKSKNVCVISRALLFREIILQCSFTT